MKFLLDSHAFIWTYDQKHKLSQKAVQIISNSENLLFLSVASIGEIQIKIMIGKFNLQDSLADVIAEQKVINDIRILPVNLLTLFI